MTPMLSPSECYSITMRVEIPNKVGMLGSVTTAIGGAGGDIGAVDLSGHVKESVLRDITVRARGIEHAHQIIDAVKAVPGVRIVQRVRPDLPDAPGGQDRGPGKIPVKTRNDLSMAYTPGVARVCMAIARDKTKSFALTIAPEHRRRRLRRDGGPRPGRHRPRGGDARHGRQGAALQGVRRGRRLADLPRHQGPGRDRPDRQGPRADLRRRSTSRTSPPRAASRSRSASRPSSTSPCSTTTSTGPPSSSSPRC